MSEPLPRCRISTGSVPTNPLSAAPPHSVKRAPPATSQTDTVPLDTFRISLIPIPPHQLRYPLRLPHRTARPKFRHPRLEIKHGRAVDRIQPLHVDAQSLDTHDFANGDSDRGSACSSRVARKFPPSASSHYRADAARSSPPCRDPLDPRRKRSRRAKSPPGPSALRVKIVPDQSRRELVPRPSGHLPACFESSAPLQPESR